MDNTAESHNSDGERNFFREDSGVIKCTKCKKELVAKDLTKSTTDGENGKVLKVRLVFFQDDGTILGKCGGCGSLIGLPYKLTEDNSIPETKKEGTPITASPIV